MKNDKKMLEMNTNRMLKKGQKIYFNTGNVYKVLRVEKYGYTFIEYDRNGLKKSARPYFDEQWLNYMLLQNKVSV